MEKLNSYEHEDVVKALFKILLDNLNITEAQIKSVSRKRAFVDPRRICMSLLKEQCQSPKMTVTKIGVVVGRKHSNVCIQLKLHINLVNKNKKYNTLYHSIRAELKKALAPLTPVNEFYKQRDFHLEQIKTIDEHIVDIKTKLKGARHEQ